MKIACYVLVLLLVGAWSAEAAVLCARKDREGNASGSISVRQECRRNEVQLDPDTVGLQAKGPAVYDANEKQVGEVITVTSSVGPVVIAFKVGTHRFPLWVYQAGFAGDDGTTGFGAIGIRVYFETPDCSGTAFAVAGSILPHIVVARPRRTVYLADPAEPPQPITSLSFLPEAVQGQDPGPCSSEGGPQIINAVPAIPLIDLDTRFTPPFSIR